jgi:hypothetical protein
MNFCGVSFDQQVHVDTKKLSSLSCGPSCIKISNGGDIDAVFSNDSFVDLLHKTEQCEQSPHTNNSLLNHSNHSRHWQESRDEDDEPTTDERSMGSIETLLKRLERGFQVQLHHHSNNNVAPEEAILYLDGSRLCLKGGGGETVAGGVQFWQELPIAHILRLEIDRKKRRETNPLTTFTLVLDQETTTKPLIYYDFEAASPIEREVIVATLMIVLDQAQQRNDTATGGTVEQPILCSPSLEDDNIRNSSSSLADEVAVIHLEDVTGTDENHLPTIDEGHAHDHHDDIKRSTTSKKGRIGTHGTAEDLVIKGSGPMTTTAWCADDVCSAALKDIAETCSGIVSSQQAGGFCKDDEHRRLMVEEYIASALGAPSAMYSYFSEDVWTANSICDDDNTEAPAPYNTRVKNRATHLNAQANRLHALRNEMTFAAALKASEERLQYIQTTQSMDDAKLTAPASSLFRNERVVVNTFHSSALLKHVVDNMMTKTGMEQSAHKIDVEVAFYDSDPEDARLVNTKGPRKIEAERAKREKAKAERQYRNAALGTGVFSNIGSIHSVNKKLDEQVIVQIVQVRTRFM